MTNKYKKQKNSLILLIVTTLFIFITAIALYIYDKEKNHIVNSEKVKLQTEINLLGEFLSDSILRRDYSQAKNYLNSWLEKKEEIRKLEVTFENGFKLFSFKNECENELALSKTFSVANKKYTIYLSNSVDQMKQHMDELYTILSLFIVFFTSLVGFVLWFILSHWILRPLQEEIEDKTQDLNNKQRELKQINNSYQALSDCNIALLEAKDEQELLDNICKIIHEKINYKLVWIGFAKDDAEKSVEVMAYKGYDDGYLDNVNVYWSDCERGNGPAGRSIREKRTVVVNDTENDPYFEPWRENALKRGFHSCAGIPIVLGDDIFGSILIYSEKTDSFLDEEIKLLKELASNLAFGIVSLRQRQEIERNSITDGLTQIYNRRYFDKKFKEMVQTSKRNNYIVSFLIMDVDHFKQYNDNYGHQSGDEVLKSVASTLQKSVKRANDYCFRLGGEEFGVLFITSAKDDAFKFSQNIKNSIEQLKIEHQYNSASKYITVSMGLITLEAKDIENVDDMYKKADELLYEAKEGGRNKVVSN